MTNPSRLSRFAWLSIGAAIATIGLKSAAFLVTGSVGLLSDALESAINLIAAIVALTVLRVMALPPDQEHRFGHDKAAYFSSGAEGGLIMAAAIGIIYTALRRLFIPEPIFRLDLGLGLSLLASIINLAVARLLLRAGSRNRSIVLEADGLHLMTDVWTSAGVLIGIALVRVTGWQVLDPLVALAVSANITRSGVHLVRRSMRGLMDTALPPSDVQAISSILEQMTPQGVRYHALRTRQSGARSFVSVQIQVPGDWTVQQGHNLLEMVEANVRKLVPTATVFTHIEPIEDPASWDDEHLDRKEPLEEANLEEAGS